MALLVVGILVLMVLPLPTLILDLLISFNITLALILLLVSMYIQKPLDLSAFPSMLLVITLFRLSLNIGSTRLILLYGSEGPQAAGKVILAFGGFVVGGNYVVGFIVFLILVLINFLVITKGAGRIAEVAARFTLDAMPGKQMGIDADLNAGFIDDHQAKTRRQLITKEAEYYGAMDGANKFVKGDAIAGILITLINIVAGLIIGVFQNGMDFADAARTYTLLTVGDGLVTQIPALIVATAAGIIVTRASSDSSMGVEITTQILRQPHAIGVAAAVLLGFALVPGLPSIPFLVLAVSAGFLAFFLITTQKKALREAEAEKSNLAQIESPDRVDLLPPLDVLALEVGYGLIPLVDQSQDGQLLNRIRSIRGQIAQEIGILIPAVHIQDNMQLAPGAYSILLRGNEIGKGELMMNHLLAMSVSASPEKLNGIPTKEPTYGLAAYWIKKETKEDALSRGYTVVDLPTVLITHLSDIMRRHADELVGRQEIQKLLDDLKETYPKVVEDLIPNQLSLGVLVKVLQNLLREQVPVRDLLTILETLADWAPATKDVNLLTEKVRQSLARTITRCLQAPDGEIHLLTVGQSIEKILLGALQHVEPGGVIPLDPDAAHQVAENIIRHMERFSSMGQQPALLCSAQVRPHLKRLLDQFIPNLTVVSYNEIVNTVGIQPLGIVELSNAD